MINRFLKQYKKTLKPIETEEVFDLYFSRIISFLLVLSIKRYPVFPNILTFISMVTGVLTGYYFCQGTYEGLIWGVVFLQITNVFDCADGQLARLKKISSTFGKTLDGLADLVTYISIYFGIAYHVYIQTSNLLIFPYAVIAVLSMFLHIMYFDHFKNQLISFSIESYAEKGETAKELKKKYLKLKKQNSFKWIPARLYYSYTYIQEKLVEFGYIDKYRGYWSVKNKKQMFTKIKKNYYKQMRLSVRLWTFFGASSHLVIFTLFALLNKPLFIFDFIILYYNILLIALLIYQKQCFQKLIK